MGDVTGNLPVVQAPGPPSFELHSLGWRAFQDLSGTVLREVLGQTFQTFADGQDAGRDGAFYGAWNDAAAQALTGSGANLSGPFVMQCKHTTRRDTTLPESALEAEFTKVAGLVAKGLCETYILITNSRVTGESESAICKRLKGEGVKHALVLSGTWMNQTIAASPRLRALVPRVYGLGDLSQILDVRAHAQARSLLGYLNDDLGAFVSTNAYRKSLDALATHGFVLLIGEPATGKSMIAAALALSSLDAGEYETVRVHTPAEFTSHWNPHEGQVLFWVDDAFGSIRHDRAATEGWARRLPELIAAVEGGAKVVMTSRNYIYYEARPFLKEYELPLFVEKQVVVEVSELTVEEKQRILYNHLKNGDQPASVRAMMKPYLPELARDVAFRPEVARRLGRQIFTRNVNLYQSGLREYMARSAEFLCEIVGQLEPRHIAALALVYTQDFVPSPVAIDSASRMIAERVGVTVADIGEGFDALGRVVKGS